MIHLVGLPHTALNESVFSTCAFTTKAVKWTRILRSIDQEVTVYWGGGNTDGVPEDVEVVPCLSERQRIAIFGEWRERLPEISWDPSETYWQAFLANALLELRVRVQPGDIIAIWAGSVQQRIVDAFKDEYTVIEPAVGYEGLARDTFAAFESYAWMHHLYGTSNIGNGRAFDAVIPGFVDTKDFELGKDEGYALFLGRLISRKGPHVAGDIAARAGVPLKAAGPGMASYADGKITATDGTVIEGEYVGVVDPGQRARLLRGATALIVPTVYIEPFGTVFAEALCSGVPVITSDWGAFPEYVEQGVDGFRFRLPSEGARTLRLAHTLRGRDLQRRNQGRFSLQAVAPAWDEWLWRLGTLRDGSGGWSTGETFL